MNLERHAVVWILTLCMSLTACAGSRSAHENFKITMQLDVGRSLDDPYIFRNRVRSLYVGARLLPNGNVEEEFDAGRGPTCRVFFEIDNKARKVVGWRYIGTEADCGIVP